MMSGPLRIPDDKLFYVRYGEKSKFSLSRFGINSEKNQKISCTSDEKRKANFKGREFDVSDKDLCSMLKNLTNLGGDFLRGLPQNKFSNYHIFLESAGVIGDDLKTRGSVFYRNEMQHDDGTSENFIEMFASSQYDLSVLTNNLAKIKKMYNKDFEGLNQVLQTDENKYVDSLGFENVIRDETEKKEPFDVIELNFRRMHNSTGLYFLPAFGKGPIVLEYLLLRSKNNSDGTLKNDLSEIYTVVLDYNSLLKCTEELKLDEDFDIHKTLFDKEYGYEDSLKKNLNF